MKMARITRHYFKKFNPQATGDLRLKVNNRVRSSHDMKNSEGLYLCYRSQLSTSADNPKLEKKHLIT